MRRMIPGLLCALCCTAFGLSQAHLLKEKALQAKTLLEAVEKMALQLRISLCSLPQLLKSCAPSQDHFFHRLARAIEEAPALPPAQLLAQVPPPPLPPSLETSLFHLLETLWGPDEAMQKKVLDDTVAIFRQETARLQETAAKKGPLFLQLSLLAGCALFILLC